MQPQVSNRGRKNEETKANKTVKFKEFLEELHDGKANENFVSNLSKT